MDTHSTRSKVIIALLACIATCLPAYLSYRASHDETVVADREADAGYKALVTSVRNLEVVVEQQRELFKLVLARIAGAEPPAGGSGAGSAAVALDPFEPTKFPELPSDTTAALRMQAEHAAE